MAPVDPFELLKAFKPLLTHNGGMKSPSEVPRLLKLMKQYSKKIVSKCTYINILLATSDEILDKFLREDGWKLLNDWLKDESSKELSEQNNYALLSELLRLLRKCPMNYERLIETDTPKLVKNLGKCKEEHISKQAKDLVAEWKTIPTVSEESSKKEKKRKRDKVVESNGKEDIGLVKGVEPVAKQKRPSLDREHQVNGNSDSNMSNSDSNNVSNDVPMAEALVPPDGAGKNSEINTENDTLSVNRPKTAKIRMGKSRGETLTQHPNVLNKRKKDDPGKTSTAPGVNRPSGVNNSGSDTAKDSGKIPKLPSTPTTPTTPTIPSSKQSSRLKESGGFIEDIFSPNAAPQPRKRKKSDLKNRPTSKDGKAMDQPSRGANCPDSNAVGNSNKDVGNNVEASNSGDSSDMNVINSLSIDGPDPEDLQIPELRTPLKDPSIIKSILSNKKGADQSVTKVKKRLRWQEKLVEYRDFELDRTERANVSKENNSTEKEGQFLRGPRERNPGLPGSSNPTGSNMNIPDKCTTLFPWRLIPIDPELLPIQPACQSEEKRERERIGADPFAPLATPEFNPREPDSVESSPILMETRIIPLEDSSNVQDFSNPMLSQAGLPPQYGYPPAPGPPSFRPGIPNQAPSRYPPAHGQMPVPGQPSYQSRPHVPYHGGPPQNFSAPVHHQNPNLIPRGGPPMQPHRAGWPQTNRGPGPGGRPPNARPPSNVRPQLCRVFQRNGFCKFQAACRYYHPTAP
ncbi:uncharacterized protein LOC141849368 isoform X2 [Brevipalpus obovatus]|uniref:uncharacterized protein LOC141849368 isoform X2 n=1 Tax=Brevipalpus obovatus TaxID=246614 RepID=UPI003D9E7B4C